jgi:hypothetical protein
MYFITSRGSDSRSNSYLGGHKLNLKGQRIRLIVLMVLLEGKYCITVLVICHDLAPAHLSHSVIRGYYNIQCYTIYSVQRIGK